MLRSAESPNFSILACSWEVMIGCAASAAGQYAPSQTVVTTL